MGSRLGLLAQALNRISVSAFLHTLRVLVVEWRPGAIYPCVKSLSEPVVPATGKGRRLESILSLSRLDPSDTGLHALDTARIES
jgi:hypothetical protein